MRYRPSYPPEILDLLARECGLAPACRIADIGSGTGILTGLFLSNGNTVFAVEPNREMRQAAEGLLSGLPGFFSITGTAEETGLAARSVDFVTVAQAFHWFDPHRALAEFARILKPGGWIVLIWNERRLDTTPFLRAFEKLLWTWGTDYEKIAQRQRSSERLAEFLSPAPLREACFANSQSFDLAGLRGRLLSASYIPQAGHPSYEAMMADLAGIFAEHERDGLVRIEYDCRIYYGRKDVAKSDTE